MASRSPAGPPPQEPSSPLHRFVNRSILGLEQVGSRELGFEIEKLKEQGHRAIAVQGYPVVSPPEHVLEAAAKAASSTCFPPSNGLLPLRQGLACAVARQYGVQPDPETQILVTGGAMHALHVVMTALLEPGDEVLMVSPCYFFGGLIQIAGSRAVYVPTEEKDQFAPDFDRIRQAVTRRTKLLVLSSPVNPTGYVYARKDVEAFLTLAEEHNLLLLSDESYDRLVYDGLPHIAPLHLPEAVPRTILVKSFTKSYALPTWRMGYIVADAGLTASFRKVLEWMVLHCPYINQRVALAALEGPQEWLREIFREFEKRRNELLEGIRALKSLSCVKPRGGPFIFLNVSGKSQDGERFAWELLRSYGIPGVAGKYFQSPDHVRIPFGGSAESVAQLIAALHAADNS